MFDTLLGTGGEDGSIVVVVQAPVDVYSHRRFELSDAVIVMSLRITFLWYKTQYRLATRPSRFGAGYARLPVTRNLTQEFR